MRNTQIESWQVFDPRGKERQVGTTMGKGTTIRVDKEIVIRDTKMITNRRMVHIF